MSAPGVAAYGVTTLGIGTAALLTGDALADTAAMRWAEYVGGAAYLAMQLNYSYSIKKGNDRLDEAIDYLNANGQEVGMISVHLYRPWW